MKAVMALMGLVDVLSAAMLFYPFSKELMFVLAIYQVAKGGFFLLSGGLSIMSAFNVIDILTGVSLFILPLGMLVNVIGMYRWVALAKGVNNAIAATI